MPALRSRDMDRQVDYVVVRRDGAEGEEQQGADIRSPSDEATATIDELLGRSNARRQTTPTPTPTSTDLDLDFDSDSDDEEEEEATPSPGGPPAPLLLTMTLPQAQATGGAVAQEEQEPTETVVVSIPPPPRPPPPHHRQGISQTTEHLLIAAGSIGATIIIVMVILAIYTMRKRGLSFSELLSSGRISAARRAPPPPPKRAFSSWDQKSGFSSDYGSMKNDNDMPPQPAAAISRSGSLNSQRPLALERSDSFTRTVTVERSASPETGRSFLLESPPIRNNSQRTQRSQRTHRRDDSATPSSPILPLQDSRRSASTRNTRSMTEGSELQFQDPPREEQRTPLPPPPTFKQFLFNRPSVSGRPGFAGGMASRFSWTNSNAPQTPHDTQRDTNTHNIGRDSYMTSRSSVPRFRTIDSWVNQQTNRLEEQQLREQFRWTQTTTSSGPDEDRYYETIPEVPDLPSNVDALREEGNASRNDSAYDSQIRPASKLPRSPPPPPIPSGLPGKNIKHERHDTRATIETAPIFRAHPGTEVRFSTRSTVPSEILDMGRKNTVLS